ncbi:response regulator [Lacipirellula parvula]|uniref:histidine kinase n=1 Tax=Lacipirellula parvula TaxID=2650471 RepID=A0A5K7X4Y6_9BACT|nr:response regulator [Lacipirellula parvula]BBO31610.1 multidomain signal transduction protein [Lacipirellula parvula]
MSSKSSTPVNVLLVDDLHENLLALEALLRREGVTILKAQSGSDALELLLQFEVALAILDVQMPGMDGFELAELMRGTERTRRVPIIFLTAGNADLRRKFRGYEAGAVDFLQKPIESDIIRSKVDVFVELFRQRQEVAQQRDDLQAATAENARLLAESQRHASALEEADRRKDDFLAVLAHELRNPLGPVRNAIEILRHSDEANQVMREAREIISRQVSHMSRLIDDLLDVARIARGKIQLRNEHCDAAEILRQTAEDYRATIDAAKATLEVDVASSLPIHADRTRVAQVIGNLLHNAAKFTPPGGRVRVSASSDAAGDFATIVVSDTGIGLSPEVKSRLFEPFSQAEQGADRASGGLGLGLALARNIAELHGGALDAESEGPGRGATFTLKLPLLAGEYVPEVEQKPVAPAAATGKLRILIVEDNADAARSLQVLLGLMGYEVNVVADGKAGIEAAKSRKPDVIMSDIGLPGEYDGYQLARQLRSEADLADIHLIAISGYGQPEDRKRSHDAGFDQHLVKPVDIQRLKKALDPLRA